MKTRIISAAVAIALLAVVLYFHNTLLFCVTLSLIAGLMIYELFNAFKMTKEVVFFSGSLALSLALPVLTEFLNLSVDNAVGIYILIAFVYIVLYACCLLAKSKTADIGSSSILCVYTILISMSMASLNIIESSSAEYGLESVILTLCGAWFADTGAYFAGTFFGKHKLCPEISPKKTVEGFIGGVIFNALMFMLFGYIVSLYSEGAAPKYLILAALGLVCSVLGLIGDLFASLIKRKCEIKDYGNIMPGHGGALDRFDSVVFVAPFMGLCLSAVAVFG